MNHFERGNILGDVLIMGLLIHPLLSTINPAVAVPVVLECDVSKDDTFGGFSVDCSNRHFSLEKLQELPVDGITTLLIGHNDIKSLPSNSFSRFTDLKRLDCQRCGLTKVSANALEGLDKLEILHLEENQLPIKSHSFPKGFFSHVRHLKELYINYNGNYGIHSAYSEYIDIFEYLSELTFLAIDSFSKLAIHQEFLNLTKLIDLEVYCSNLNNIPNDSLRGFENSNVKRFKLSDGTVFESELGLDVFQYLPKVSHLAVVALRLGNQNALRMMKPLVGREMDSIMLSDTYSPAFGTLRQKNQDGMITVESTQYLGKIVLSNFYWYDSFIYSFESDAFFSPLWQHCLKTILIQNNELIGSDFITYFKFMLMKKLETLVYLNQGASLTNRFIDYLSEMEHDTTSDNRFIASIENVNLKPKTWLYGQKENNKSKNFPLYTQRKILSKVLFSKTSERNNSNMHNSEASNRTDETWDKFLIGDQNGPGFSPKQFNLTKERIYSKNDHRGALRMKLWSHKDNIMSKNLGSEVNSQTAASLVVTLPPSLRHVVVEGLRYFNVSRGFRFRKNCVTIAIMKNFLGTLKLHGKVYGLDDLRTINLEGSRLDLALDFFDTFPSLGNLTLRRTTANPVFFENNIKRIVENLIYLEYLDIAENGLRQLASDTFRRNNKIKHLCLANNKFYKLPFNLKHTPELEILDLRGNEFVDVSAVDRAAINDHISLVSKFTVLLSDNMFSCACSNLPYIAWLQSYIDHFDQGGNLTCISEDGALSNTANHKDVAAFWRKCEGSVFLLTSLTLVCAFVAGYVAVFFGMNHKTQIISKVMQHFVPGFRLKTKNDFSIDVCIGYADQDVLYVRDVLLRYLENKWKLRTFVHHRDQLQDALMMSRAIRNSWRCLLLITDNFLHHYEMGHNMMMVASFFVSPANPRSVVVMVEERVQHQIPDYILQVVDDDNIIVIPGLQDFLDYETKETLRTRLLT